MKKIVLFFFLVGVYTIVCSQTTAKKDLEAINKKYAVQNNFTASVNYSLFINGKLDSEEKAKVSKKGTLFNYSLGDLEIINSKKYKLFINHTSKEISVMPAEKIAPESLFKIPLDSAIAKAKSYSKETIEGGLTKITLLYENMPYEKIEFYFIQNNYSVTKIKIQFSQLYQQVADFEYVGQKTDEKLELQIAFNAYTINPSIAPETFSETKYISITGNKISLAQKYKNYELFDFVSVQ